MSSFQKNAATPHSKTALRAVFCVSHCSKVLTDSQILARKPVKGHTSSVCDSEIHYSLHAAAREARAAHVLVVHLVIRHANNSSS